MSEAKLLRALADKIDDLESVTLFPGDISDPGEITVAWTAGSDHEGYQPLNAAIGALVKQHWNALRSQVVKQRQADVQAARTTWTASINGTAGADPVGPSQVSEVPLRKVIG